MSEKVSLDSRNPQQVERKAQRAQANREELVERIAQATRENNHVDAERVP